jgi:hypothetical protein
MFIRYEINQGLTNNTTTCQAIMSDIYGAITGTITSTSGFDPLYANQALSEITGDMTALQPDNRAVNTYHSHSYSNGKIEMQKRHYENTTTYDYNGRILLEWNYTSGRPKFRAGSTNAYWPYNNYTASHYWVNSSGTYIINQNPSVMRRISVFASKYWFIVQFEQTDGKIAMAGLLDHTVNELDKYNVKTNPSAYNAQVVFHSIMTNPSDNTVGDSNDTFSIGKAGYGRTMLGPTTGSSQHSVNGTGHLGYLDANDYYIALYPFGSNKCAKQYDESDSNIAKSPLHPLHVIGLSAAETGPYLLAKVPQFYRTEDQIAANSEDVTIDSVTYKCVRMHKSGSSNVQDTTNADSVACYLIPKTIGGN